MFHQHVAHFFASTVAQKFIVTWLTFSLTFTVAARRAFEQFKADWKDYPGAIAVWENNFTHVEQLYTYGYAVRKIMYTTNAIESVNSSFRKVTKKGAFPNEDAVFKIFYLRILELQKKWESRSVPNWALVRNQLLTNERMAGLMEKYDKIF